MSFQSLSTIELLLIMEYLKPMERYHLVLSGALGGMNFTQEKVKRFRKIGVHEIKFGAHHGGLPIGVKHLEITKYVRKDQSALLEELFKEDIMRPIRRLELWMRPFYCAFPQQYSKCICSLEHLQELHLVETTSSELCRLASSCHNITVLSIGTLSFEDVKMIGAKSLNERLSRLFGKLNHLNLKCMENTTKLEDHFLLEMLSWCHNLSTLQLGKLPDSMFQKWDTNSKNLDFGRKLRNLKLADSSADCVKKLLLLYPNIHKLEMRSIWEHSLSSKEWRPVAKDPNFGKQLHTLVLRCNFWYCLKKLLLLYPNVKKVVVQGMCAVKDLCHLKQGIGKVEEVKFWWYEDPHILGVLAALNGWHQLRRLTLHQIVYESNHPVVRAPADLLFKTFSKFTNLNHLHLTAKFDYDSLYAMHDYLELEKSNLITSLRPSFSAISASGQGLLHYLEVATSS